MNIQIEKKWIVQQLDLINDPDLIAALKNILDFGIKMQEQSIDIPQHHKDVLEQRLNKKQNASISLDELNKRIKDKI